jgi:hypothetical protein
MVGYQYLVSGHESERTENRIDPRRGIGYKDQIGGIGAGKARKHLTCLCVHCFQFTDHEPDGLALKPVAIFLLFV